MAYTGKYSRGLWSLKTTNIEKAVEMIYGSRKAGLGGVLRIVRVLSESSV